MSVAGGLFRAIERAEALGCEAIQIFTRNPLQWHGKALSSAEVEAFRRAWLSSSVEVVVAHASYLINLAGDSHVARRSTDALVDEISRCYQLGIDGVVLHPGSAKGTPPDDALRRLAESLSAVLERTQAEPVPIFLETMSGQGDVLGANLDELTEVMDRLEWDSRLRVCVDLCHVFGAGYDVAGEGGYERLVSALSRKFGLERIACWHLSDNRGTRGSRVDRHAHIGQGEIGATAFGMLVSDVRFARVPAILETPKDGVGDEGNLALLRKLRGRE